MLFTKVAIIYSKAFYNSLQCDLPLDKVFLVNPRTWTWTNMDVQELEEKLNFRMENSETLKIVQRVTEIIDVIFDLAEKLTKDQMDELLASTGTKENEDGDFVIHILCKDTLDGH